MRKFLSFLFILPLFSFIVSCEDNADVQGFLAGDDPQYAYVETFLTYYVRDGSELGYSLDDSQITALSYDFDNDMLITKDRFTGQLNVKGYGYALGFYILEDRWFETDAGGYTIVNPASLKDYVHYRIYAGYQGENREELEAAAVKNINEFLGQTTSNAGDTDVFIDDLFLFGKQVLGTRDPNDGRYDIISHLLEIGYTPENGGKRVIIDSFNQSGTILMYQFVRETAQVISTPFNQIETQFTVDINDTVYDY